MNWLEIAGVTLVWGLGTLSAVFVISILVEFFVMVTNASYIQDKGRYTDLQVLRSAAGYYIGTMYINEEGWQEPGSRDSGYFPTYEDADVYLQLLLKDSDAVTLRQTPIDVLTGDSE